MEFNLFLLTNRAETAKTVNVTVSGQVKTGIKNGIEYNFPFSCKQSELRLRGCDRRSVGEQ